MQGTGLAQAIYDLFVARETRLLHGRFDNLAFGSNPFRSLDRRFVVASSARTGSHLLAQELLARGAYVAEHFNPNRITEAREERGIATLAEYCDHRLTDCATAGDWGVKGPPHMIMPLILAGEFPDFLADWRFVHLTRANEVRQAISWMIGDLTLSYRSYQPAQRVVTDDDFNPEEIARYIERQRAIGIEWEAIFQAFGVKPLQISYEELAADTEAVVARTADHLGLRGPPITDEHLMSPPLEIQSTDMNDRWEARFRDDARRRVLATRAEGYAAS